MRVRAVAERARGLARRLKQQCPEPRLRRMADTLQTLHKRLRHYAVRDWERRQQMLGHLAARLDHARAVRAGLERERAAAAHQKLKDLANRMKNGFHSALNARRQHTNSLCKILSSLDYHRVLTRGFALVRDENNQLLRRAAEIADGVRLDIEFADGHKTAIAEGQKRPARIKRPANNGRNGREQGSLF
jgi:exodeoxyribonuclease VII large subunit